MDNDGLYTSIAIAPSGTYTMHVSYYDSDTGQLKYAYWDSSQNKWVTQVVDQAGDVGSHTSIALDPQGVPHIAYLDDASDRLKYATLSGTAWISETVTGAKGHTSLAFGGDGYPRISYKSSLEYSRWDGSKSGTETLISGFFKGEYTSLALEPTAPYTPHISHYDFDNEDLLYTSWDGTKWVTETVDSAGNVGSYSSLALDSNRRPHISYFDDTNNDLRYAYWDGSKWVTQTVDSAGYVGTYTSLALDSGDRPHIAYHSDKDLRYAYWNGSRWVTQTVDSTGNYVGAYASLALDGNDHPHISYFDGTRANLKYAYWDGTRWISETVDSAGEVGEHTSIALDDAGNIYIAYYDLSNRDLKYAFGRRVGVALTGNRSGSAKPSQTTTHTHILTNTGSYTDIFSVASTSSRGWASVQPNTPVTLGPGATTTVKVVVAVPANAISGTVESTVVTVTSQADGGVQVTITDATAAGHAPGVAMTPNRSGQAYAGGSIVYVHTLTNTGNGPDAFTITCTSSKGWGVSCGPNPASLGMGASAAVKITVVVPANVVSGTVDTAIVTATSQADGSVLATVTDTTKATAPQGRVYLPLVVR
ncbi:MAG: hypothetical protein D6759_10860, partial [Chloroflexi bacterium]